MTDWLTWAVNETAGRLSEFWIQVIANDWRDAGQTWLGIAREEKGHLDRMLSGGADCSAAVEIIFASRLHFLHAADPPWCEAHVLALLDWKDPEKAVKAWSAFLTGGRWSENLLSAGLLDHYLSCATNAAVLSRDVQRQLSEHLAAIAAFGERNPVDDGWLAKYTRIADEAGRVSWITSLAHLMNQSDTSEVERHWNRWMRRYIEDRLASIPCRLTPTESSALARWVVCLGPSFPEGVALLRSCPAGLTPGASVLHDIREDQLAEYPGDVVALVAHLLGGTAKPFHAGYAIRHVVSLVRENAPQVDLTAVIEGALSLGCDGAGSW